jgi:hypothetical protein
MHPVEELPPKETFPDYEMSDFCIGSSLFSKYCTKLQFYCSNISNMEAEWNYQCFIVSWVRALVLSIQKTIKLVFAA